MSTSTPAAAVLLLGDCPAMQGVRTRIGNWAPTPCPILILGETGTGKQVVAQEIHSSSDRGKQELVVLDCSSVTGDLCISELFGHKKGAFTGAIADRAGLVEHAKEGTLFLDEVQDASPALQALLRRLIETGEYRQLGGDATKHADARIIMAMNQRPQDLIRQGVLRSDLYHRIKHFEIELPPLRERGDDVVKIAEHYVRYLAKTYRRPIVDLDGYSKEKMRSLRWPGNVRELRGCIERAVVDDTSTGAAHPLRIRWWPEEDGDVSRRTRRSGSLGNVSTDHVCFESLCMDALAKGESPLAGLQRGATAVGRPVEQLCREAVRCTVTYHLNRGVTRGQPLQKAVMTTFGIGRSANKSRLWLEITALVRQECS